MTTSLLARPEVLSKDMADSGIIAYMYASQANRSPSTKKNSKRTVKSPKNLARYVPLLYEPSPGVSPLLEEPDFDNHSEPEDTTSENANSIESVHSLRISLDDVPKGKRGIEAGFHPKADIVLPHLHGISARHFSLTFNDDYYLVVKDLGSVAGTCVCYGEENGGTGINTEWIIASDPFIQHKTPIKIRITTQLEFVIAVQPFDRTSAAFRAKVDAFRAGSGADALDEAINNVVILPETVPPSAPMENGSFYLRKEIGRGASAVVYLMWHVSTRELFVCKVPVGAKPSNSCIRMWKKEAALMSRVTHPNIVQLLGLDIGPPPALPVLRFEYVPDGSISSHLEKHKYFTGAECRQILQQTTSAIAYLHGLEPPITHRDISDNNILIKNRSNGSIEVKLADFGMSKEGEDLNSVVGTPRFWPPELYDRGILGAEGANKPYTNALDIWELGAVIAKLAGGMPKYTNLNRASGAHWCQDTRSRVQRRYKEQHDDLDRLLLKGMLCMKPSSRWDAKRCHAASMQLSVGSRETWRDKARASAWPDKKEESGEGSSSDSEDRGAETERPPANARQTGDGKTAEVSGPVTRSDAPPPEPLTRADKSFVGILAEINDFDNSLFLKSDPLADSTFSEGFDTTVKPADGATFPNHPGSQAGGPAAQSASFRIDSGAIYAGSATPRQPISPRKRYRDTEEGFSALKDFLNESSIADRISGRAEGAS